MKSTQDKLLERFRQIFSESTLEVEDESHLHVGHAGAEDSAGHFKAQAIDAKFNELQRIDRHQLLYKALSEWMPNGCMHWISSP